MDEKFRTRPEDDEQRDKAGPVDESPDDSGEHLARAAREGKDLIAKANDAIRKALSSDSATFLAASRQTGGQ